MKIGQFISQSHPNAVRDLARLAAFRLGASEANVRAWPEEAIPDEVMLLLRADLMRLERGTPMAHILGSAPFLDWTFRSDARALIPRPETEALCEIIIRDYRDRKAPGRILDLCCGSGVIGLALALAFPQSEVTLTDISAAALDLASENVRELKLGDRVTLIESDLWQAVPVSKFDLITANPPYVADDDEVERSVLEFEPDQALYSDDRGMAHAKAILAGIKPYLTHNGRAVFELGHAHRDLLTPWLETHFSAPTMTWKQDPFGVYRYLFYDAHQSGPTDEGMTDG